MDDKTLSVDRPSVPLALSGEQKCNFSPCIPSSLNPSSLPGVSSSGARDCHTHCQTSSSIIFQLFVCPKSKSPWRQGRSLQQFPLNFSVAWHCSRVFAWPRPRGPVNLNQGRQVKGYEIILLKRLGLKI